MNEIKITELQIIPVKPKDGLIAFASFVFNNQFYLSSIGLFRKPDGGFRLVYPTKKFSNGKNINIFYPISKEVGDTILKIVSEKYEEIAFY